MSFQWFVHTVWTGKLELLKLQISEQEPDERAQECPSNAAGSRANRQTVRLAIYSRCVNAELSDAISASVVPRVLLAPSR